MSAENGNSLISVNSLRKIFKIHRHHRGLWGSIKNLFLREHHEIRAVDGITFNIEKGELVGYLGPNGAGKSTTIKMLSGLLVPSEGEIKVSGRVPWKERREHVANIGTVFGQRTTLWWDLPVIESLSLLQHIYDIPKNRYDRNMAEFREILELDDFIDTPVRSLSLGQRMRSDLCAALLHDPQVLFLDEPTIGLDVVAKERIRRFIQHLNQEKDTTIILTTHDISDIARLCRRVIIIDLGRLIFDGPLDTIMERFGTQRELIVDLAEPYDDLELDGAKVVGQEGLRVWYQFERNEITASQLINSVSARFRIIDLSVQEPEIETTIRRIYEEGLLK
jgi:ABC-2 type transport system ATP-binding protein